MLQTVNWYSCNDQNALKCSGDTLLTTNNSLCTSSLRALTRLTAVLTLVWSVRSLMLLAAVSGTVTNVCSFPSAQANSDDKDCVSLPNRGSILIAKTSDPAGTGFTFTDVVSGEPTRSVTLNSGQNSGIISVPLGSHTITETTTGWATTVTCTSTRGTTATGTTTVTFTVNPLERWTCAYNNIRRATLIVQKVVDPINGGTKAPGDFTLNVTGDAASPSSFSGSTAGQSVSLLAGAYNVTETVDSQYDASYGANCSGTIAAGETKTCVVTNTAKKATLIVIKDVINDNGGSLAAANFQLDVSGGTTEIAAFPGSETGTSIQVNAGTYTASEAENAGYAASYGADCVSVTLAPGETKTCTITNDDKPIDA